MNTVDFSTILRKAAGLAGIPRSQIMPDDFDLFTGWFDTRLKECWEIHRWPDLCPIEQRTFAAPYDPVTTYAALAVVFDLPSHAYYISLQPNNTGNAPTLPYAPNGCYTVNFAFWQLAAPQYGGEDWTPNTPYAPGTIVRNPPDNQYYSCFAAETSGPAAIDLTAFALLAPLNRVIAYAQSWPALNAPTGTTGPANVIGEFIYPAYDRDPRMTTRVREFPFTISQDGAQFTGAPGSNFGYNGSCTPPFVWILFRLPRPVLSGEMFDATAGYGAGESFYYTSTVTGAGNFYAATQTTNAGDTPDSMPAEFTLQGIPQIFETALVKSAYADWLRADGQGELAQQAEADMWAALELEADKLQRQSGQMRRLQMH